MNASKWRRVLCVGMVLFSACFVSPVPAASAATVPIPAGYLRVQTGLGWRGQTTAWYVEHARSYLARIKADSPASSYAGVALVDRATGQVLAKLSNADLAVK